MAPDNDNDLEQFTQGAARAFGFQTTDDPRHPRTVEQIAADEAAAADDQADAEDEDAEEAPEPTDAEIADAFWDSLSDADRVAAERSPTVRDGLLAAFLADQGYAADDDGEEGDEQSGDGPASGLEMIAFAYENADDLTDEDGDPMTTSQWIAWALHAEEEAWAAACRAAGWDPRVRIGHEDLRIAGRDVQGEQISSAWDKHLAALREQGRYFGS